MGIKRSVLLVACCCATRLFAADWTNAPVRELHLYKNYGDSAELFDANVNVASITNSVGRFLETTVDRCGELAAKGGRSPQSIASMRGRWLEWALLVALKAKGLTPAYWQAEFVAVPRAYNDVTLWSKEYGPVIMSCKTSLRERYKQADLEALALRGAFPNGRFYLVTLDADKKHVARVRKKIAGKEILALQQVYDEETVDELFSFLKTLTITEPGTNVLHSATLIR